MKYERISNGLLTLTFAVALTALSDCDPKDPQPKTELEKLPPATQEGKYTFGCLVNGNAWVTKHSLSVSATYQFGVLQIGADESDAQQAIFFAVRDQNIEEKSYELNDSVNSYAGILNSETMALCEYTTDGSGKNRGRLIITRFDKERLIISGLFEFVVSAPNCSTYVVTDGRFDLKFIP